LAIIKKDLLSYFTFNSLDEAGLVHGVFMRHGGCSPAPWKSLNMATSVGDSRENVIENRKRISAALGVAENSFYDLWQVHSSKVVYARQPRKLDEEHLQADAIMTDKTDVSILMLFADCVPILFYDPEKEVIACAHAGWQGTFKWVAAETVKAMQEQFDSQPGDIKAAIGPSICAQHYEVGQNVVEAAQAVFEDAGQVIIRRNGRVYADLQRANELILRNAGVLQVEQSNICTMENTRDWFSHRGENGKAGRFGAVITLKKK
jgi:hypothetical protein